MPSVADEILAIFAEKGQSAYYGEDVSQLEHALQAAHCAQRDHASDALVVAALVHDIGHLVDGSPEDIAEQGIDARHEEIGRQWLRKRFGRNVCEPAHLHVDAKRYLCATEPDYLGKLSVASIQSLKLQGGPMTPAQVTHFESNEFHKEAVALRRWDDEAKIPQLDVPGLDHYRQLVDANSGSVEAVC